MIKFVTAANKIHVTFTPTSTDLNKTGTFIIRAFDGLLWSDDLSFNFKVYNTLPVFVETPFPSLIIYQGHTMSQAVTATDADPGHT